MEKSSPNFINEISMILITLIVGYFVYRAYVYLGNLDNCDCAPKKQVQHLKMIELYYLFIILAGLVFNVLYLIFNIDYSKFFSKNNYLVSVLLIYILSLIGVYFYYVYNVIEFKEKLNPTCQCSNKWQNNIIYIHVLYLSLPIVLTILSAFFNFKININVLTYFIIAIVCIYFYEDYLIKQGTAKESMISMLGSYKDMVFEPKIYEDEGNPFDKSSGVINPNYGNFAPSVGQPLQKYYQLKPEQYPAASAESSHMIQTPMSTHESLVFQYRAKMPNLSGM